jgi:two-component system OmpR family sensor kinase
VGARPTADEVGVTVSFDHDRLAVLVHEVRSPVAALAAISETFGETLSPSERVELARLAITACRGIERVVLDAMTTSVRRESVSPGALVREVVAAALLGGARIEADVEDDIPSISADPLRLRQALDNLVANALIHSGADAPVVVGASPTEGGVELFVSDSGSGIPPSEQARIFDAGIRLDGERPGSGLGLAIARAIARAHGGDLAVTSVPGEGATFTITLPARHPET